MAAQDAKQPLKEDLSRMEGAYGSRVIKNLKKMRVFLKGLTGLGIETAKNLVLAGPKHVTVHDDELTAIADLNTNFYLTEADVGKPRGASVLDKLRDLNPNVDVALHTGDVTEAELKNFEVVVFMDKTPLADLIRFNNFCRAQTRPKMVEKRGADGQAERDPTTGDTIMVQATLDGAPVEEKYIKFIYGNIDGAAATVFSDFGDDHVCFDKDGTPLAELIVEDITNAENGVITVAADRHGLDTGDRIRLEQVEGMSSGSGSNTVYKVTDEIKDINSLLDVKYKNARQFQIGNTSALGKYTTGGIITQVKVDTHINHKPLEAQVVTPDFNFGYMDFTKLENNNHLHLARQAIWRFQAEHKGEYPRLHSAEDADAVVALAKTISDENKAAGGLGVDEVNEGIVRKCALYCRAELPAMAALMGGVVAQEIVKNAGKYSPISQWFHFDSFELLNDEVPADATPVGSRYDHHIAIFGKAFQEKMQNQNVFIVGVGALGCEYLKLVATTGLGCEAKGQVHITDDDHIELSNLSRQFLFRRKHVGAPKSKSAGAVVGDMNPAVNSHLQVHEIRVEPATENVFTDAFWDNLDFVVNALDNNIARKYTDSKCVRHGKPLFESGTLGTQANTVIVRPGETPSYGQGAVAGENQGIAMCTLRNFPSLTIHCIEWARQMFDDTFSFGAQKFMDFREDPAKFIENNAQDKLSELDGLKAVKEWVAHASTPTWQKCVELAYETFEKRYRDAIKDLTHAYPRDARRTGDGGKDLGPFWHGKHRYPNEANLDPANDEHVAYLWHTAHVYADVFGVQDEGLESVRTIATSITPSAWTPSDQKIMTEEDEKAAEEKKAAGDEEKAELKDEDRELTLALRKELLALDPKTLRALEPADFEKDDDTNHHIDWITSACNLRCFNYNIKPATAQKCRMTAGRIIAAIATTTACITGFVGLEIYKHLLDRKFDDFRMATIDLGVNTFVLENLPDKITTKSNDDEDEKAVPEGFSLWDQVVVDRGDLTVGEFLKLLPEVHPGVAKCKSLWKAGLSKKEIDEGKGQAIYESSNPFSGQYRMHSMLAKRSGNSAEKQAIYERTIKNYEEWGKKYEGVENRNLREAFEAMYGPPSDPARSCYMLEGTFDADDEGTSALIPVIKYVFKH